MSLDDAFTAARMRSLVCLARPTAHELRGALNAMQMHLALLSGVLDEPPDAPTIERRRRYLDVVGDECRRLQGVVSAFLDLVAPPDRTGETDPASLVAGIVDAVRPLAVE